ncbi:MAG: homoserine kinase [Deltaproteobacteria bacterium]|nr:homoserine kinase [Deltaproteobacteria bacterium]MCW5807700.1 homoserine kinase [Deltaproteobacteria bacterium]
MGVFTRLQAGELAEIAAAFDLGAVERCAPMAAGTINSNFDAATERGRWFVRINEGKAEVDVAWEARLVEALAAAGVVTPAPLRATDGRPYTPVFCTDRGARKWVSVFPWRPGRHLTAAEVTPVLADALGAALAQLHVAGEQLPTSWRRGSIYDHDHLVARFARFSSSVDPALAHAVDVIGDELAAAGAAAAIRRRASSGIIHGDLFRDNVLWEGDRVSAILDFEQASGGSFAYDIAVCLNDWCWTGAPRLDLAQALLAGYGRVRPLTAADRAALPIEVRAAATRFTITRVTDVYLARVDNPDKDFRAFLARVEAWRGPALGQLNALL